ncbi:hypothetical protein FRB96_009562 [Tulasnella sp. 330]|nr:hypothetical protein FRB96_009562 [Tulasnella sp. 330]
MEWHEAFHIASDPTLIYEGFSNYYYPTKNGFTVLAAACLHAVWLWRLHAIWTYKLKVLIGPIVILFIAAGCSIVATLDNTRQVLVGDSQPTPGIETWALIAYVAALLCAILVSILIISRIYWISLRTELRVLSVRKVPHALIEGGMLYTFMIFLVAVSYGLKKAGSPHITEPLCHALPMIMAITLTLIIMNLESDLAESPTDFIGVARPRMLQLGRDRNKKNLIVSWPVLVEPGDGNNSPVTAALDTGYIAQQTPRTPRSPRPSFGGGRERPRFGNDDREERGLATAGVERTFDRQLSVSGGSVGFPRARSRSPNPDRQAGFNAPRRSYTAGSGLGNDSPPRSHYPGAPMPHGV